MTRLVARIKIMPSDADQNIDNILESLKGKIPDKMELKAHAKEPIAFGIFSLVCDFILDDEEGQMDKLEDSIKQTDGVGEIEIINVSRQSVKLK